MVWTPLQISVVSNGLTIATNSYVTGNQLGGEITLTGASLANGGSGAIVGVSMVDYANILGGVDMYIFSDTTTPAADRGANAWSDADMLKNVPGSPISLPAPIGSANNRGIGIGNLWIPYKSGSGHSNLYLDLVTRSGHTFFGAVDNIKLTIAVMQYS